MWAWVLQRASAAAIVVVLAFHLQNPFIRTIQFCLLSLVLLHMLLGIRAMVFDLGAPLQWQRPLFGGAVVLVGLLVALVWWWRWY